MFLSLFEVLMRAVVGHPSGLPDRPSLLRSLSGWVPAD